MRSGMSRAAKVFGLGILFRAQEFILGIPISPWTDLLRVDVLNILGLSMVLLGVLCWVAGGDGSAIAAVVRMRSLGLALAAATAVALATPAMWTTWRPKFLPWPVESYVNGVHIFDKPQVWLFPIFPWVAFAFVGLAVGLWLFTDLARRREELGFLLIGVAGLAAIGLSMILDGSGVKLYGAYDYWHTSPNFFLARCGVMLVILS